MAGVGSVDATQFKRALGLWASGVSVVSTQTREGIYCMTASSFSSLSLDPLLILICVAHTAKIHDLLLETRAFAVNFLRDDQRALGEFFARTGREPVEQLDAVRTFPGPSGSPIFDPCLAFLDCRLYATHPGGDHTIFVGEVLAAGSDESARPLVYFNRGYRGIHDLER